MIGNKIKALYKALNLNRLRFAKAIGYDNGTIIKIENGAVASLSSKLRKAIYQAFPQVNPDWLEHGKGPILIKLSDIEPSPIHRICQELCETSNNLSDEDKILLLSMLKMLNDNFEAKARGSTASLSPRRENAGG